ncbi:hypothetical protein KW790_00490 [Candidatus Parcubacteria bacterium]|nr:hypothetical protein [Candidatus Parcubacteria bacterium]
MGIESFNANEHISEKEKYALGNDMQIKLMVRFAMSHGLKLDEIGKESFNKVAVNWADNYGKEFRSEFDSMVREDPSFMERWEQDQDEVLQEIEGRIYSNQGESHQAAA